MGYIGKHGVEALHRYKYSGIDKSYMAKYIFQPFWSQFIKLFPLWMPPNMITLSGFLLVVASALLSYGAELFNPDLLEHFWSSLMDAITAISAIQAAKPYFLHYSCSCFMACIIHVYSPYLDSNSPRWIHFVFGMLLFLYQTFDAVDGKQARRTNSSSPLGELFDHGCDALVCAFEAMAFGASVVSGKNTLWFWAIATIPFYMATWEHFFTNTLILPEVNGPTEGLMLIYLTHIFTAVVGPMWWTKNFREAISWLKHIPIIPDMPVNILAICIMIPFAVAPTIASNIINVHKVIKKREGSMLLALAMLLPFFALLGGVAVWGWLSPSDILHSQPHLVLLGSGFAFGYLVGRIVLSHLCDEPKGLKTGMCMSLLFLPFGIANALSSKFYGGKPMVDEFIMVVSYCAFAASLYVYFAVTVINEITTALGIHCFRITKQKK